MLNLVAQFENVSMATGPPTQATGTPRSGAGVGGRYVEGCWGPYLIFFGFRDLSRFHHLFVGKNLGEADRFGPTQNSRLFSNMQ